MEIRKKVQQIKVERGSSFPDARKAVFSEHPANTFSKRTAALVFSSAIKTTQQTQKKTTSTSTQTELTRPEGTDSPVPVKHNGKSQTTQETYKKQDNTKPANTTSPSPPPRASKAGNAPTSSTGKGGHSGGPSPPTVHF